MIVPLTALRRCSSTKRRSSVTGFFTEYAARLSDGIFGLDRPLDAACQCVQIGGDGLWHRAARAASAWTRSARPRGTIARLLKARFGRVCTHRCRHVVQLLVEDARWLVAEMPHARGSRCNWCRTTCGRQLLRQAERRTTTRRCGNSHPGRHVSRFCRQMHNERLAKVDGDWARMIEDIKVYRLILSEQDRIGNRHLPAEG